MPVIDYPFTQEEAQAAYTEWGCNCGPTALAFALQSSLDHARNLIHGFDQKRYTSPSMMSNALYQAGRTFQAVANPRLERPFNFTFSEMYDVPLALVRIQWTGPWTAPGANPKWAYRQTHWVATWLDSPFLRVFDCNGGINEHADWEKRIVPMIVESIPRADGGWFPTHIWRLNKGRA